jgi:hypothetical protein
MPINGLSAISGLDEKRHAVLAQKLDISTCYELIMADRQRIVEAFGRRIIRPTLEEVAIWQDEARRIRNSSINAPVPAITAFGWEPTATFVVAFEERRRGDATERRMVAEQTEVEPDASPQQRSEWPDWACDDACQWMRERVGAPTASAPPPLAQIASVAEAGAAGTVAIGTTTEEVRSKIDIERANLTGFRADVELVAGSRPVPQDHPVWAQPARLFVTLGGAPTGSRASVVLQLVEADGQKQSIAGRLDDVGRVAEIKLSGLSDGEYKPAIVACTPDGSFLPRVVKLPLVALVGSAPSSPP